MGHLNDNDPAAALKSVQSYTGHDELVKQIAALPLIAGTDVVKVGSEYMTGVTKFQDDLTTLALVVDKNQKPTQAQMDSAKASMRALQEKSTALTLAMRADLGVRG